MCIRDRKDGWKSFENGLPVSESIENVDTTIWGRVPTTYSIVNAFDNDPASRSFQDIGLDGLNDSDELSFYSEFTQSVFDIFGQNSIVYNNILYLAGDFMLSGHRIIGKVICHQGGHGLTNLFLRKLFNTKTVFEVIELSEFKVSKKINYKELDKIAVNA